MDEPHKYYAKEIIPDAFYKCFKKLKQGVGWWVPGGWGTDNSLRTQNFNQHWALIKQDRSQGFLDLAVHVWANY